MDVDFGFLFGAGTSKAYDLPSSSDLTRSVLNCELLDQFLESDRPTKYTEMTMERNAKGQSRALLESFLNKLRQSIELYNAEYEHSRIDVNYENIHDLASQILVSVDQRNRGNAALRPYLAGLREMIPSEYNATPQCLVDLAHTAVSYIEWTVSEALKIYKDDFNKQDLLVDAYRTRGGKPLDIFTLNCDRQIEGYCKAKKIPLVDGFDRNEDLEFRLWNHRTFETSEHCIRLFKVHGSINLYNWDIGNDPDERVLGIARDQNSRTVTLPDGRKAVRGHWCLMLVGTENKIMEYSRGQPLEMLCAAKRAWDQFNTIIIIGYSFRDLGINRLLHYWMSGDKNRRLLIVILSEKDYSKEAYTSFQEWAERWKQADRLALYPKESGFEYLTWEELERQLAPRI